MKLKKTIAMTFILLLVIVANFLLSEISNRYLNHCHVPCKFCNIINIQDRCLLAIIIFNYKLQVLKL